MKNISNSKKKFLTILTIVALLVMIIPVAVMAKDGVSGSNLPDQASENAVTAHENRQPDVEVEDDDEDDVKAKKTEAVESESESENKSDRAKFVAERNELAGELELPAGHVNLIYKLADLRNTPDNELDDFIHEYSDKLKDDGEDGMSIQGLLAEIKTARGVSNQTGNNITKAEKAPKK